MQYLVESLQQDYELAINWNGTLFCGITLTWNYTNQTVNLSMPAYIAETLTKFQYSPPVHPQHLPHKHNAIKDSVQVPLPKDTAPLLSVAQCKHVQEKNAVPLQQTLKKMGHHQPKMTVTTDNSTA